jgi:hypothetical protein
MSIKLSSPRLRVITGNVDDESTWTEYEFQTIGQDSIMAETLAGVQKWGRVQDHALRYLSAMAYYAMLRNGKFQGGYDEFERATIEVQPVGVTDSFPTVTGPEPD